MPESTQPSPISPPDPQGSLRRRSAVSSFAALVAASCLGGGAALGAAWAIGAFDNSQTTTVVQAAPISSPAPGSTSALSVGEIYRRAGRGVVQITTTSASGGGLGSGFVIDHAGHIVTNYHVIQGASSIEVLFSNNVKTKATVVGTDKSTDLAVLKVNVSPSALTPLSFGDSSALEVGDPAVAIGNPFGLDRSITSGIVSAIYNPGDGSTPSRSYPVISTNNFQIPAIQTDAAINHGNSGGPLLNSLGQVVGVNSQIETGGTAQGNVGVGFAIQSNTVKEVVAQIIKTGKAAHAYIGVQIEPFTPGLASQFRLPVKQGLLVTRVVAGTGAAKAGLKAGTHTVVVSGSPYTLGGDIIVAADGTNVGSAAGKLEDIIARHKPGDKISLEIYRGSKKMTVSVTLGNR